LGAEVAYQPRVEKPGSETLSPDAVTFAELCTFQPSRRTVCPEAGAAGNRQKLIAHSAATAVDFGSANEQNRLAMQDHTVSGRPVISIAPVLNRFKEMRLESSEKSAALFYSLPGAQGRGRSVQLGSFYGTRRKGFEILEEFQP